jgi:hypothetical protein
MKNNMFECFGDTFRVGNTSGLSEYCPGWGREAERMIEQTNLPSGGNKDADITKSA